MLYQVLVEQIWITELGAGQNQTPNHQLNSLKYILIFMEKYKKNNLILINLFI